LAAASDHDADWVIAHIRDQEAKVSGRQLLLIQIGDVRGRHRGPVLRVSAERQTHECDNSEELFHQ
jgi:hypothetical protein